VPPPRVAGARPPGAPPPPMLYRNPPPPPAVPFAVRRPVMVEHPGRPLEPVQVDALRAARPVGPMVDHEFPPHVAPVIRETPTPPPPAARTPRVR
jgi:hypothetical protein